MPSSGFDWVDNTINNVGKTVDNVAATVGTAVVGASNTVQNTVGNVLQ